MDQHQHCRTQVKATYMVKLPNGMPTDGSNKVGGHLTGPHPEMGLNHQQVISNQEVDIG